MPGPITYKNNEDTHEKDTFNAPWRHAAKHVYG
jgi:hypothetical protein